MPVARGVRESATRSGDTTTHPYVACWPPVYTVVLDHAATPPQLPQLGDVGVLPGELLGELGVPAHALTACVREHGRRPMIMKHKAWK